MWNLHAFGASGRARGKHDIGQIFWLDSRFRVCRLLLRQSGRKLIETEEASGAFNLTAPESITNGDLARLIGQIMGRPAFIPVPGFAMRTAFGEVADVVLKGQRAVPKRLLDLGFDFRFPNAEAALHDLLGRSTGR